MKQIWKFALSISGEQCVVMPRGAEILCVQMQHNQPQLWALCDPGQPNGAPRTISIHGTGNNVPDNPGRYIGTFQMSGGALIWHAFEVTA